MAVQETTKVDKGEIIKSETVNLMIDNIADLQSQVTYNYNANEEAHTEVKDFIRQLQAENKTLSETVNALTGRIEALESK